MKLLKCTAFILLGAALPVSAQITYTAAKIVFNNPGPYTQTQLEDAAGMHAGTKFNADDLGGAAQRLVDTGFFDNVGATLSGSVLSSNVLFDISPTDPSHMLHVGFENFVWLTHTEIEDLLHAKSPLFADYLPESSPLAETFSAALVDALAAKGVAAKISYETVEPTMLRPERSLEFRIKSPAIRVANVKLAGVAPELVPLIQKSLNATVKSPYDDGLAGQTTSDRLLAPLFDAGYARASLSNIELAPSTSGDAASVILSATLNPGDIYHVSNIEFAGTPLLSANAFAATQKLHAGDLASRTLLLQTLAPLDLAYRQRGFMDVIVDAKPTIDLATHQIAYSVSVRSGEPYRVKEVTAKNLDPAAHAEFERSYKMKTGELFNPDYLAHFLKNNPALLALQEYSAGWKAYADPNTHTVDLVLTFFRGAGQVVAQ